MLLYCTIYNRSDTLLFYMIRNRSNTLHYCTARNIFDPICNCSIHSRSEMCRIIHNRTEMLLFYIRNRSDTLDYYCRYLCTDRWFYNSPRSEIIWAIPSLKLPVCLTMSWPTILASSIISFVCWLIVAAV